MIIGIECETCDACRGQGALNSIRHREREAEANARPRREIRPPRHYDSSPDMDQPWNCEHAAPDPTHPLTFVRDFFDEIDGRQRPVCNACRHRECDATVAPARHRREDGVNGEESPAQRRRLNPQPLNEDEQPRGKSLSCVNCFGQANCTALAIFFSPPNFLLVMSDHDSTAQPSSGLESEAQSILAEAHARLDRYCKKWHEINPSIPLEGDQWAKLFKALLYIAPPNGKLNIAKSICKSVDGESEDKTLRSEAQLWRTHLLQACMPSALFLMV